ncbi:hypothetical protein HBH92_066700 [Parastagonospora nodorum]|nr:hypothetical protein HBI10_163220 [Parastagonospora nodorum]KAH4021572.1 hypothetical protein HBI13_104450 [Parastagonospora nodorum]KAH4415982.1 hypothetical protein HBH92_066700 [Parastagonospora nodorum]KAH4444070.1 hypothetical protein HBH93_065580 [Parastagonospora nodorum]KAH4456625.1 hypothetical protein HBH91_098480 [Parastagonospora nodorum]
MSYSPPSSAKPFTLNVSDQDLSEWRQLLQLSKLPPTTYENTQTKENFGVTKEWMSNAKDYWLNKYDWRAQEKHINSFDNFRMQIDSVDVHFVALFSEKKDAVPIILMHGWPGSFIEFLPMLELVKKQYEKKNLPYHLIVPSLPGYTLSCGLPTDKDWTLEDSAIIMHKLMMNLGFERYLAQGGDVGSFVAKCLANEQDACVGIHLNMFMNYDSLDQDKLTAFEKERLGMLKHWEEDGMAYAKEHGTRPSTIGHALSSSPLALLAWIGEKFLDWTDPKTTPGLDDILTNISLYWFTSGYPTSLYPYRALTKSPSIFGGVKKPTGASWFPYEMAPMIKHVMEEQCELVFFKQQGKGGHFAALECPKEMWEDLEEFVPKVWKA